MALCLTRWKDGINTVSSCVWQQFFHNFTYILCINSKFATSRPSKFIIIYLGKPLVQARTFYVEYSEECGIVNRWIYPAHLNMNMLLTLKHKPGVFSMLSMILFSMYFPAYVYGINKC